MEEMLIQATDNAVRVADYWTRTGRVCGRSYYFRYYTFPTYCLLDYVNCMEKWDVWELVYMGECIEIQEQLMEFQHYPYENDYFLDQYYPLEYGHPGK